MNIAICGASGFVGTHLRHYFARQGVHTHSVSRDLLTPHHQSDLVSLLNRMDVVINLCGANINKRWTKTYRCELYLSRLLPTRMIVSAINGCATPPRLFISASAVGYYADEVKCDEDDAQEGTGMLADLCRKWEHEAQGCRCHTRVVTARFGVVMSPNGGALRRMLFMQGLTRSAAIIGKGKQWLSWIGADDLCRAIEHVIDHKELCGAVNMVCPNIMRQRVFALRLAEADDKNMVLPVPAPLLRLLYGRGATVLTHGQYAYPKRLTESGFEFQQLDVSDVLHP